MRVFVYSYKHRIDADHISSELRKVECVAVFDPDNVTHMLEVHFTSLQEEGFKGFFQGFGEMEK